MHLRIVVANQSEADFYDVERISDALRPVVKLTDPKAHLHDRDFNSDRPGRVFDHASGPGRRGGSSHHSTGGERTPRRLEAAAFAARIAEELEQSHRSGHFDRLIIMAGPSFLGLLRKAIPESVRGSVVAEIPKDLIRHSSEDIRTHVPREALW